MPLEKLFHALLGWGLDWEVVKSRFDQASACVAKLHNFTTAGEVAFAERASESKPDAGTEKPVVIHFAVCVLAAAQ